MYEWAAQLIRLVKTHQRFHTVNWVLGSRSHEKVCTLDTWPARSMTYLILWIMFERELKKNWRRTTDWLSRKQSRRYSSEGDRREGRGRSVGQRAHSEEKKGRHFYFDFLTQTYDYSILLLFDWIVCRSHQKCRLKKLSSIKDDYSDHFQWFMLNYEKKIGHQSGFSDSYHVVFPQVRILIILKDFLHKYVFTVIKLCVHCNIYALCMNYRCFFLLKTSPWEHSKGNQMQHNDSLCLTGLRS